MVAKGRKLRGPGLRSRDVPPQFVEAQELRGGRGPKANGSSRAARVMRLIRCATDDNDLITIWRKQIALAKRGNRHAVDVVFRYLIGRDAGAIVLQEAMGDRLTLDNTRRLITLIKEARQEAAQAAQIIDVSQATDGHGPASPAGDPARDPDPGPDPDPDRDPPDTKGG